MWIFRPLLPDEATEACTVIRRSIEDLCIADHDGAPEILGPWLANKKPDIVRSWIEGNPGGVIGGVSNQGIGGVGGLLPGGRITMNYVAPWARFRGVSKGMMRALEARAAEQGEGFCTLTSTVTAHAFYLSLGYEDFGEPVVSFGGKPAFPMRRAIARQVTT
jgi:GNAT superfamily N-acetyltransferase